MTKAERSKIARELQSMRKTKSGGRNGGRPKSDAPRCACGQMTAKLAAIRKHKCNAEEGTK
jgi:hypothetical protein